MKGLDKRTTGDLVKLMIFIVVTTVATSLLVVTIGNVSFGDTKEYKADGRVGSHATRNPWSDGFQRLVEQPLIDSQVPPKKIFETGEQADNRGRSGRTDGDQCGGRCLPSDRSTQQGNTDEHKRQSGVRHHRNEAWSKALECRAVDGPTEENESAHRQG